MAAVVGLIFAYGLVNATERIYQFARDFVADNFFIASDYNSALEKIQQKYEEEFAHDFGTDLGGPIEYDLINEARAADGAYTKIDPEKDLPNLSAESFIVADVDTGEIIAESQADVVRPIASLTKLMTALVSIEMVDQNKITRISERAIDTYGRQGGLRAGEEIALGNLLFPLLMESSNDAAEAVAEFRGRELFLENMNHKATAIGMNSTHFDDPSGLSEKNVSTARDLFLLIQEVDQTSDYILYISRQRQHRVTGQGVGMSAGRAHTWYNNSKFLGDNGYLGSKNGYTDEAGHTLISVFELPLADFETRRVAIILLDSAGVVSDVRAVTLYLLQNVEFVRGE